MDMKSKIAGAVAAAAAAAFEGCALTAGEVAAMLETPPERKLGDYALPCFRLSKTLRKGPPMIAAALAEKLSCPALERCEVVGGYLNFFLDRGSLAREVV